MNREARFAAIPAANMPLASHGRIPRPLPIARRIERGATLVIALIFLLLLTIIGVTAVTTSTLQEKMSANLKDKQISFDGAESALRAAESWLSQQPGRIATASTMPCAPLVCAWRLPGDFSNIVQHNTNWWISNGTPDPLSVTAPTGMAPEYVIEQQAAVKNVYNTSGPGSQLYKVYYRITANAWGATPNAVSTLQEDYVALVP